MCDINVNYFMIFLCFEAHNRKFGEEARGKLRTKLMNRKLVAGSQQKVQKEAGTRDKEKWICPP